MSDPQKDDDTTYDYSASAQDQDEPNKEPEGEPEDEGTPKEGGQPPSGVTPDQLLYAVQQIALHVDNMTKGQEQKISALQQQLEEARDRGEAAPADEDVDLEGMNRKEFAGWLENRLGKRLSSLVQDVDKKVETVSESTRQREIETEIERSAAKHGDFYEWVSEMRSIHEKNPTLSVEDAYMLARAHDPKKAAQLDAKGQVSKKKDTDKQEPEKDTQQGKDKSASQKGNFGGMTPGGAKTSQPSNMTPQQAAEDAWEKTMAKSGFGSGDIGG